MEENSWTEENRRGKMKKMQEESIRQKQKVNTSKRKGEKDDGKK